MNSLLRKCEQARAQLDVLPKIGRLLWRAAGKWTVLWAAALALSGLLPIAVIWLTKRMIDQLAALSHGGFAWQAAQPALLTGALIVAAILIMELLQGGLEWLRAMQSELLQDRIAALVQEKATEVDLAFYETPAYFDQFYRAQDEAQTRPPVLLENLGSLLQNGVSLIMIGALVAGYSPWLLVLLGLSSVPAFSIVARYNWLQHGWWQQTTVERRWLQYYDQKFASPAMAPELRLYRLGPKFRAAYQVLRKQLRVQRLDLIERQTRDRMLAALAGLGIAGSAV